MTLSTKRLPVWLSPEHVCDMVPGMTVRKLQRFRDEGRGPRYAKVGNTIVYSEADVHAWLFEHVVPTRDQPGHTRKRDDQAVAS